MNGIGLIILGSIITAWVLLSEAPDVLDAIIDALKGERK